MAGIASPAYEEICLPSGGWTRDPAPGPLRTLEPFGRSGVDRESRFDAALAAVLIVIDVDHGCYRAVRERNAVAEADSLAEDDDSELGAGSVDQPVAEVSHRPSLEGNPSTSKGNVSAFLSGGES